MKKILGISLVALFTAVPMLASAADDPVTTRFNNDSTESGLANNGTNVVTAAKGAYYAGKTISETDKTTTASAAYVKGAYNDTMAAINKVSVDAAGALESALTEYTNTTDMNSAISTAKTEAIAAAGTAASTAISTALTEYTKTTAMNNAISTAKDEAIAAAGTAASAAISTALTEYTKTTAMNNAISTAKDEAIAAAGTAASTAIASALTEYTTTSDLQSAYATKDGVLSAIERATASVTGVSLGVTGSVTGNVPLMVNWGDSSVGSVALVSGTIASGATATGTISGIDVAAPASYAAE